MAFVKKTWKDRIVQYANRRLLTKSGGEVEQVTVTRDEGTISEAGDQFNASNMNNLENRVKTAFDDLNGKLLPMSTTDPDKVADRIEACETAISGKLDASLIDLIGTVGTGFQYVSEKRCLLYFYSDTAHANGFRVEFNGLTKQVVLSSVANGVPTTLATFSGT